MPEGGEADKREAVFWRPPACRPSLKTGYLAKRQLGAQQEVLEVAAVIEAE